MDINMYVMIHVLNLNFHYWIVLDIDNQEIYDKFLSPNDYEFDQLTIFNLHIHLEIQSKQHGHLPIPNGG